MIKAVYVAGSPQLYDVFLADGTWLGSRRTFGQAYAALLYALRFT
jgi:hypothetical protein